MLGAPTDGKIVLVNHDFTIRVPHGAGYELYEPDGDEDVILSVVRFDELPPNYNYGEFQLPANDKTYDEIKFQIMHEYDEEAIRQMDFAKFLNDLKSTHDERFARSAVGAAGDSNQSYRALKIVQNTPEIKAGYLTRDLFVAARFHLFIFTERHGYSARLKVGRQGQKFKRTEFLMTSLLSSVKPNTI